MSPARPAVRRWPLHPAPGPVEALSSWLARVAACYGLTLAELLRHNLGPASTQLSDAVLDELDTNPPAAVLAALAERTGVGLGQLRAMTISGWVPWLSDTLAPSDPGGGQELFDTYVRQDSVLLRPGQTGRNRVHRWPGPWLTPPPAPIQRRVCPGCAADPRQGDGAFRKCPDLLSESAQLRAALRLPVSGVGLQGAGLC